MDEVKPAKIPLEAGVSRCLGHNGRLGNVCENRDQCARHVTISHMNEPWTDVKPPYYRMCSDDKYHCFMEIEK